MLTVTMVGASFRPAEAKEVLKSLEPGDVVELVADPTNPYDANAVEVRYDDVHIGFIPKESNSALSAALQDGDQVFASIIGFESTLKPILEIDFGGDTALGHLPEGDEFGTNWGDDG